MAGTVTFTPAEADYLAANLALYRRKRIWRWQVPLAVALGVLAIVNIAAQLWWYDLTLLGAFADSAIMIVAAVIFVIYPIIATRSFPKQIRLMMQQNRALREPVNCTWNDTAITFTGSNGVAILKWADLHRWFSGPHGFVFLQTDRSMHVLPRRSLSEAEAIDLEATATDFGPSSG